jgi:phospholipase/carboxylesterase
LNRPALETFTHRFQPGAAGGPDAALLLLHGTGGNESDLPPLAELLAPGAAWLSPRGRVLENGMPRWFRRLAEGVLDEADLAARAHELADYVTIARAHYGIAERPLWAVGFSNGANIASAILLLRPETLAGAVLLRPMLLFARIEAPDLAGRAILIGAGEADPMVPREHPALLAKAFEAAGAEVLLHVSAGGHGISMQDAHAAREFLATRM